MKIQESDLFQYLRDYFKIDPKNEIFTEVAECGGPRPDIVIRNGKLITVVEMKTSLSMKLLEQAFNWRYKANYVYIAIPKPKSRINRFVEKILNDYGIGLLLITVTDDDNLKWYKENNLGLEDFVHEEYFCKAKLFRDKKEVWKSNWDKALKDMYRYENNCNGGNKGGGYNTEYRCMIDDVKRFIKYHRKNEWTSIKDILDNVESVMSHYRSPKASLYSALTTIEFKDIETTVINNKTYFRVKSSKDIPA